MMKHIWERRNSEGGFTLVELLVVIVILGVLAAVAVFAVSGITNSSQKSACKSDVTVVQTASDAFYTQNNNTYAASIAALKTAGLLRQLPATGNGYTVTYSAVDGSVTGGSGSGYAGCPA